MFEQFLHAFGYPEVGSGVPLETIGLAHSETLRQFVDEVGSGLFAGGFLSLVSKREQTEGFGGWEDWLPQGTRLFASTACGFLAFTKGEDLWLIDTQYGEIVESDFSLAEFIIDLCQTETREYLREPLFKEWQRLFVSLPFDSYICPVPAISLGGNWNLSSLQTMKAPIFLSFTGQLFSKGGDMPAEVRWLAE